MKITYRIFTDSDTTVITEYIHKLYHEDPGERPIWPENIHKTIESLTKHPDRGSIIVFDNAGAVIGYAILINYWSNEFGGNIINIDELYIKDEYRSQGIGTRFIEYLKNIVSLEHRSPYNWKVLPEMIKRTTCTKSSGLNGIKTPRMTWNCSQAGYLV
ncbi:GNAT family N-acetyltransferase [Marispirochaeta sp.]|uniref:GNAT family N-acetyltransferase n=1 Tax=Marispirochaeta sp. TaxID=2038653 RepID=UPI0029C68D4F|nr:GNAT family N-acetyltransferase [Marispirochaeta sp.]